MERFARARDARVLPVFALVGTLRSCLPVRNEFSGSSIPIFARVRRRKPAKAVRVEQRASRFRTRYARVSPHLSPPLGFLFQVSDSETSARASLTYVYAYVQVPRRFPERFQETALMLADRLGRCVPGARAHGITSSRLRCRPVSAPDPATNYYLLGSCQARKKTTYVTR